MISRSPHGRTDVMFGPVITTEAHLAFSGARAHSNNTAEMTAILKHCLSLVLIVQWSRMSSRVFIMIFSLLLVYAWARSRLVRMCSWHACQRSMIFAQRKLRLTMQHVYGHSTVEIWVMNVLTMPLHLGPSASPLTTTLPSAGFIITLTHPRVLMAVTSSLRSWNDYNAFEQMQRRFPKIGVGVVFTIGFIVFIVHLTRTLALFCVPALSLHLSNWVFVS